MMLSPPDILKPGESPPPKPEDYGLYRYSSPLEAAEEVSRAMKNGIRVAGWLFWTLPILLGVVVYMNYGSEALTSVYFAFIAWMVAYLASFRDKIVSRYMKSRVSNHLTYISAYKEWEDINSEKGFSYWRNQKGREFENSVSRFFERRGWKAQLTPTVGDGGVDVILKRGAKIYWCQCKGHAKSISVSEVRRIAGAAIKSNGSASPVLIATNGFTRPALDEAKSLNVICIDAMRLTQMAQKSDLPVLDGK